MKNLSVKTTASLVFLVVIWGISWPIYKLALAYTPPLLFAGMRALIGGLLLSIYLLPAWKKIKWRENWIKYCLSALLNAVLFFGLQTIGLNHLPGGLSSVLVYFQPVLIGLFAWFWLGEKMTKLKVIGLIIGFVGILAASANSLSGQISIFGVAIALLSAVSWALGTIYVKKESKSVDAMWMAALQFTIGGIILTGLGIEMESWAGITWNSEYIFGLGFGSVLGIAVAFALYLKLMNAGEASKVASFTFLVPLIAVATGTIFMHEPFTLSLLVGLVLIVLSIYFVNHSKTITKAHSAESVAEVHR
ncbi:DMT family transporter [Bacillus sp. B190/17]|uniref:DMT family transporter n=1 Tax=Bacillus lumedeiriae TaxID=3058829 RepID=A0ABW8IE18_9BACI